MNDYEAPRAIEAEKSLLGSIIKDKDELFKVISILNANDFYGVEHKKIYSTIKELFNEGTEIDLITISNKLNNFEYLAMIIDNVTVSQNAMYYAKIIKDSANVRNIIKACEKIKEKALEGGEITNIKNYAMKEIDIDVSGEKTEDYIFSGKSFIETMKANKKKPTISTGFLNLNRKMGGGIYSGLYVLGGMSSLGKTAFTLQMADNIASEGHDVIFFSLEMSKFELEARNISRRLFNVDRNKYKNYGTLEFIKGSYEGIETELDGVIQKYENETKTLSIKEGNFNTNIDTVRAMVQAHINKYKVDGKPTRKPTIFIDYLQILKGKGVGNDKQEMDFVATELKRISRDFDIPVIVVSSFSRSNYYTQVGMESFKESGAIEYTSDVLIGLQFSILDDKEIATDKQKAECREAINEEKKADVRSITAVILKQRNAKPYVKQKFIFHAKNNTMQEV